MIKLLLGEESEHYGAPGSGTDACTHAGVSRVPEKRVVL